jgi:UvrD/REP helicase N-terminal domain
MNLVVTPTLSSNRRGLTAEQAKAAYADSHVAVIAGAGTGKTHMLSERYLHLLMHHGFSPLEIVAVTFTRKAAAELRSRIRQTVTRALPDQPSYLAELEAARISTYRLISPYWMTSKGRFVIRNIWRWPLISSPIDFIGKFPIP